MAEYGAKMSEFARWVEPHGMPLVYLHHIAAVVETEPELDAFMANLTISLLFDAGYMAFAGGDVLCCMFIGQTVFIGHELNNNSRKLLEATRSTERLEWPRDPEPFASVSTISELLPPP